MGVPMQKSIRFFMMMLPAFFARVKPVSTMAKPACMKNTRAAAISTQMVLTDENIRFSPLSLYRKTQTARIPLIPRDTRRCVLPLWFAAHTLKSMSP